MPTGVGGWGFNKHGSTGPANCIGHRGAHGVGIKRQYVAHSSGDGPPAAPGSAAYPAAMAADGDTREGFHSVARAERPHNRRNCPKTRSTCSTIPFTCSIFVPNTTLGERGGGGTRVVGWYFWCRRVGGVLWRRVPRRWGGVYVGSGGAGWHDAWMDCGLMLAGPVGPSPLTLVLEPFPSKGGGAHHPVSLIYRLRGRGGGGAIKAE